MVLAVDMPSGLPSDGNAPEGDAVYADCTVTIGLPKVSLVTYPGKEYAGVVEVADIGFPVDLTGSENIKRELIDESYAERFLPFASLPDVHKGERGHLLLVGGFEGLEGAIIMTASAAIETGVGLATLFTTAGARDIISGKIPELMTRSLPGEGEIDTLQTLLEERRYDGMIIGPGMGRTETARNIFLNLMNLLSETGIRKVLVDGDGLFHLSSYLENNSLPECVDFILTPHFGEASRLLKREVVTIKENRVKAAEDLAEKTGAAVILKGPSSIISGKTGTFINTTGNPALATGGTGDLLSGITGAIMLREDAITASSLGAYIHGAAADLYCAENSMDILKATDLIGYIRKVLFYSSSRFLSSPE
jgi:NAD(P)H-hydrate epimerase